MVPADQFDNLHATYARKVYHACGEDEEESLQRLTLVAVLGQVAQLLKF